MEPLIAVYSAKGKGGVVTSGWRWIKSVKDAVSACKKALKEGEQLAHVHACEWRNSPSKYSVQYGPEGTSPTLDMAANLRNTHLRKKGEPKPRIRYNWKSPEAKPTTPAVEAVVYPPKFILLEAESV